MRPTKIFQNIKVECQFCLLCVEGVCLDRMGESTWLANKESSQFKVSIGICVVAVVVSNVVGFSGEDIGGQMREMAIFGVPC